MNVNCRPDTQTTGFWIARNAAEDQLQQQQHIAFPEKGIRMENAVLNVLFVSTILNSIKSIYLLDNTKVKHYSNYQNIK